MDLTPLFHATVQTYKVRNKSVEPFATGTSGSSVSRSSKECCPFTKQAKTIKKDIVQLRDFLLGHRKDYVNIDHLLDGACLMTDYERDQIDTQSQSLIKTCQYVLENLRKAVLLERCAPQRYAHRQAMVEIVQNFLKVVTKIYSEQRAIRVQRAVERKKLSKLENLVKFTSKFSIRLNDESTAVDEDFKSFADEPSSVADSSNAAEQVFNRSDGVVRRRKLDSSASKASRADNDKIPESLVESVKLIKKPLDKTKFAALEADVQRNEEEWAKLRMEINPAQRLQLEAENKVIYQEFNEMVDELTQLEGKVVEIAKLQEVFTEKVLQQEQDIFRINEQAIHTTENIKSANESIRDAMKKKSAMRVYIMFFLIVMSLTLWFLDWYNP